MKKVYMTAIFEALLPKNIDLEKKPENIAVGGFSVRTKDGDIPFDFDTGSYASIRKLPGEANKFLIQYQSGEGPFFNEPDISDCYNEEYEKLGLSRNDITAKYLAGAEALTDFFVKCWDNEDREVDPTIKVIDIAFSDENNIVYPMTDNVIADFNKNYSL